MDSDPKDRNANAIAQQILDDYEIGLRISENEAINAAYAEIKEAYGEFGTTEFIRLYDLVGDSLDIEKAVISIGDNADLPHKQEHEEQPRVQELLMKQYGISYDGEKYLFGEYRYENFRDALKYAKLQSNKATH